VWVGSEANNKTKKYGMELKPKMERTKPMPWEDVEPQVWKPESEGASIEGVLVQKKSKLGLNDSNAYYIEDERGNTHMVWGSTVLDDRMAVCNVGDLVKITYIRKTQNKRGQPLKLFKVQRSKSEEQKSLA